MRYTVEQRVFICSKFIEKNNWRRCQQKFQRKYPGSAVPDRTTICRLVAKFKQTGSVLDKKAKRERKVLTEEKLHEISARLEANPKKSLRCLAQQVGVSKGSAQTAARLLKIKICEDSLKGEPYLGGEAISKKKKQKISKKPLRDGGELPLSVKLEVGEGPLAVQPSVNEEFPVTVKREPSDDS